MKSCIMHFVIINPFIDDSDTLPILYVKNYIKYNIIIYTTVILHDQYL